jgi:hypothetical protein
MEINYQILHEVYPHLPASTGKISLQRSCELGDLPASPSTYQHSLVRFLSKVVSLIFFWFIWFEPMWCVHRLSYRTTVLVGPNQRKKYYGIRALFRFFRNPKKSIFFICKNRLALPYIKMVSISNRWGTGEIRKPCIMAKILQKAKTGNFLIWKVQLSFFQFSQRR